jgi:uncharacterized protein YjbI with pentapeptide repeats
MANLPPPEQHSTRRPPAGSENYVAAGDARSHRVDSAQVDSAPLTAAQLTAAQLTAAQLTAAQLTAAQLTAAQLTAAQLTALPGSVISLTLRMREK